ncbi:MAG: hypothetical protein ACE5GC_04685 [Acidimicrobiia bacterium]
MSIRSVVAVSFLVVLPAGPAGAQETIEVSELLELSADLTGFEVTVEGELIGDYGVRSDGSVWVQLNDDAYAGAPLVEGGDLEGSNVGIGLHVPADVMVELERPGGYRRLGPQVTATGTWMHHDPVRGGESYLEVTSLVVVDPGRGLDEDGEPCAYVLGTGLFAAALLTLVRRSRPD